MKTRNLIIDYENKKSDHRSLCRIGIGCIL